MSFRSAAGKTLPWVGMSVMLLISIALTGLIVYDYLLRDVVPAGVTIAGKSLARMPKSRALQAIQSAVSEPMLRPVTVMGDGKSWVYDPADTVEIDENAMLKEAYSSLRAATLITRLDSALRGTPLPFEVKPAYSVDSTGIASWVASTSVQVDRRPVDAVRRIVPGYRFKITKAKYGARVDQPGSVQQISAALTAEAALAATDRTATLAVTPLRPKVVESDFKRAIIVSLSQCRIRLYHGTKLVREYPCAPGRPAFPTPTGDFFIQSKQRYAPWINPGTPWAASMPAMIPGGPGNPMGTTKIGINWPGVFMHGIPPSEYGSIGTHASHACMRMFPSDVLDLYGRVTIGDPVFIRP